MNQLKIDKENRKDEIIKQINKFRLENKNNWYQVEIKYSPFVYKIKAYNTWVQIFIIEKDGVKIGGNSSSMDITATQFKNFLNDNIK